ncbi:MAG: type I-E CRISPR-associated endonuclease Cas1e [Nitratireductor sp.]
MSATGQKLPGAPPPRPIPLKERASIVFVERGQLDVIDGAFVLVDAGGVRTVIPVGGLAAIMLEPGTRASHAAISLAARAGTLLIWVGEGGVRLYATGQPGGARADRLLWQCRLAMDETARLKIVRRMFALRFGEAAPERRSVDQLRGIEGARVRTIYQGLARQFGIDWSRRKYDPGNFDLSDTPNRCLSAATSCLYGVTEAAVLAAGYAPAVGFLHSGKPLSFVYDIADLFKFETVVPVAFRVAAEAAKGRLRVPAETAVRHECRDSFRKSGILGRLVPAIGDVLSAGDIAPPEEPDYVVEPVFADDASSGDEGMRG